MNKKTKIPFLWPLVCALLAWMAIAFVMTSCAQTVFYVDGKPVARFQGDMVGMEFERHADGSIHWKGDVNHSAATLAQGKAAEGKIQAVGVAAAAAGVASWVK